MDPSIPAHLRVGALVVRRDDVQAGAYRVERHLPPDSVRIFHCADGAFWVLPADALSPCPPMHPVAVQRR